MSERDRIEALGDALRNECYEGVYDVGVVSGDVDTYLEAPVEFPGRLRGRATIMEQEPGTVVVTITTDGTERNTSGETCEATAEAVRKTLEAHEAVLVELDDDPCCSVCGNGTFGAPVCGVCAKAARPVGVWELAVYDRPGEDSLVAVTAAHYNEFAKLVDALAEIDETVGDTIRAYGDELRDGSVRFDAAGYTFELTAPSPVGRYDASMLWATPALLREVAIQHERSLDADADPDDVKAETVERVTRWWVDQVEGGGSDWDEYGEKFARMLLDGFQYQLAYEEKYPACK